ncbi:hypothetical protein KC325_g34 [Hortaea werneckii]|nr:hypothetical protein KC325_g34 [Hortaea werneckii]
MALMKKVMAVATGLLICAVRDALYICRRKKLCTEFPVAEPGYLGKGAQDVFENDEEDEEEGDHEWEDSTWLLSSTGMINSSDLQIRPFLHPRLLHVRLEGYLQHRRQQVMLFLGMLTDCAVHGSSGPNRTKMCKVKKTCAVHVQSLMNGQLTQKASQPAWKRLCRIIPPLLQRRMPLLFLNTLCIGNASPVLPTIRMSLAASSQIFSVNSGHSRASQRMSP